MLRTAALSLPLLAFTAACSPDESAEGSSDLAEVSAPPIDELHLEGEDADTISQQITPQGWGPLTIGMSVDEITAAAGPDANPEAVGSADPEACDQFRPANAPEGVLVMVEDGALTRISLTDNRQIRTDAGLTLGASSDEVRAAYNEVEITPHKYEPSPAVYIDAWQNVEGGDAAADNPDARGIRYVVGSDGFVDAIHAGGPSIRYVEGCL